MGGPTIDQDPRAELGAAAALYYERPADAEAVALSVLHRAVAAGALALRSRALSLLGAISLNRGDLRGAFRLTAEAQDVAERSGDPAARADAAVLAAQLHFWSGGYSDALREARSAVELADGTGDDMLRLTTRRGVCVVMGNLEAPGWSDAVREMVALSIRLGDRWQEAISRNDLGHLHMVGGDLEASAAELVLGARAADALAPYNRFAYAVLDCTRAELRLAQDDEEGALADIETSLAHQEAATEIHPYLYGMSVRLQVQVLLALERPKEAERCGDAAIERLGDRVPQARGMILQGVAAALREGGYLEAAYDALARSADLERQALLELAELQVGFERATADARAARMEADRLADANRSLSEAAHRDSLTGLHNRRYLDARLAELAARPPEQPVSLAVIDLDNFKQINDDLGHAAGDAVLVRVGALLAAEVRAGDHLVRSGGEELVVVMPATDEQVAIGACERFLMTLRQDDVLAQVGLPVTGSAGVATWRPGGPLDPAALLSAADARLYAAKRAGRDRVVATVG